jgi:putative ABC transport system substrate-binding protein
LVSELLAVNPDLLVADATQAALATQRATHTIPIVVPTSGDLVRVGLVKSLAHPGGNLTGLTLMSPGLIGKRLAVLKEMAPHVRTVGILLTPDNPAAEPQLREAQAAATQLELKLQSIPIRQPNDIDRVLSSYARRIDAVFVTDDPIMDDFRTSIGAVAIKNHLPCVCSYRMPEDRSCLMWYGPDLLGMYKRAASYVAKILNGTKPADLPVEQPAKLTLVINAKTASDIGLPIPQSLLLSADEVIR